jgi:peptidoglycan hydrolase-like protein with peptidoglycan-binding domain
VTAAAMLAAARRDLGLTGRPNKLTRAYAARHGAAFLSAPWCQMAVTAWARASGNTAAVLPRGDRAYTVYHARDGEQLGRWHLGTVANIKKYAAPGGIVFFDWRFTDAISAIDHVGVIEKVLGDGRLQTIEGNTGDSCKRRLRSADVIAGFWVPAYVSPPKPQPTPSPTEKIVKDLPKLKLGDGRPGDPIRWDVKTLHYLLMARAAVEAVDLVGVDDTVMSPIHVAGVRTVQKGAGLPETGRVDERTWAALLRVD